MAVKARYSAMWPAKPMKAAVDRQADDPQRAVGLVAASPGWRRQMMSTS